MAPPDLRFRALEEARAFRASWLGMAELLSEVEAAGAWTAWGFPDFATYCRRELDLRPQTVAKLTRSFAFLAARQPAGEVAAAPRLDVVDLLARAPAEAGLPPEAYESAVAEVMGGAELSRDQLLRRMRRHDPQAFRPRVGAASGAAAEAPAPEAAPPPDPQALKKTLAVAARLVELVDDLGLGDAPRRLARAVLRELRGREGRDGSVRVA